MGLEDLVEPVAALSKLAEGSPASVLHQAALADSTALIIGDAKIAGLAREVTAVEKEAREVLSATRNFERIEGPIVRQAERLLTFSAALRAGDPTSGTHKLVDLFGRISPRDRIDLGLRAIILMDGRTLAEVDAVMNSMAGQLREVVSKSLPAIERAVADVRLPSAKEVKASRVLQPIDSCRFGAVELPGRLRDNERFIRLGTDRLVGLGRVEPAPVAVNFSDGTSELIRVSGVLDVGLAVEVKGRSNAGAGIGQLRSLQQRGQQGYGIIGGQLWLLTYDPKRVRHLLVAPPGTELSAAAKDAVSLRKAGFNVEVVEIPKKLDDQIKALARQYLRFAASAP